MENNPNIEKNENSPIMEKGKKKCRINAHISRVNYKFIDELLAKKDICSMRLSKGAILDLALTNLNMSLESGESLDMIAINHIERENDDKKYGDWKAIRRGD